MRYSKRISVRRDPREVFAYLADFSNAAEWDPGVVEARRLSAGPIVVGSRFELIARFRRNRLRFEYVVTALDEGRRIRLHGDGDKAASDDTITVAAADDGTTLVTYEADIRLKGVNRLAGPLLAPVFRRMGDRALASLQKQLDEA